MRPLLAFLAIVSAGATLAHDGATGIVRERMDGMVDQGRALKTLTLEVAKPIPDPALIQTAAAEVAAQSGQAMLDRFPKGSLQPSSEALPIIWEDWERFADLAFELEAQAIAIATATPEDAPGLAREISKTCTACHDQFRLKN